MRIGPNPTQGCVDGVIFHVNSDPRRNFGSTSPLFSKYTSRRGGCVSGEQQGGDAETISQIEVDMETNPIYASSGCPNNVDNSKEIRSFPTVSLSNGRRLTRLRKLRHKYKARLYLGWRWSEASGAGRPTAPRNVSAPTT